MRLFLILFFSFSQIFACENRNFSLSLMGENITLNEVLAEFSKECSFSVIYDDKAIKKKLQENLSMINFKDKSLDYVFELLFSGANLHYTYKDNVLKLAMQKTKTFKINYLSTARKGSSSTSVAINQQDSSSFGEEKAQGTSKSGVDITSYDDFNFWETIHLEISSLLKLPKENSNSVIINKGAGLITVRGDKKSLKAVESYIKELHNRLQKQVLIDVHILSIKHSDSKTIGINWNALYDLQNVTLPAQNLENVGENALNALSFTRNNGKRDFSYGVNIFSQGVSLTRIVEFLKNYGEVSSVSNPKVLTLNNQPALISVGDILRYKKSSVYQNTNSQTTLTNTDDEYPSVFAGVLLDITPLVFEDEIMLKINPSITKTRENMMNLPSNAFETPPNLTTNQLSSIVKVRDKEKVILGGLISKNTTHEKNKIPLLGDIPLLKYAFSYSQDLQSVEEIVFIIEPKIIKEEEISLEGLGYTLIGAEK